MRLNESEPFICYRDQGWGVKNRVWRGWFSSHQSSISGKMCNPSLKRLNLAIWIIADKFCHFPSNLKMSIPVQCICPMQNLADCRMTSSVQWILRLNSINLQNWTKYKYVDMFAFDYLIICMFKSQKLLIQFSFQKLDSISQLSPSLSFSLYFWIKIEINS